MMAFHWAESVYTASFTPREYQVELLDAARDRNIIMCLSQNSSRDFIGLKIIQHLSNELHGKVSNKPRKCLYLVDEFRVEQVASMLSFLTDLTIGSVKFSSDWDAITTNIKVLVTTVSSSRDALLCNYLELSEINVMIVENCHNVVIKDCELYQLMDFIRQQEIPDHKLRIVGITGPLYSTGCFGGVLAATLQTIEQGMGCDVETASDIVSALRYSTQPIQFLVECNEPVYNEIDQALRNQVNIIRDWLNDHRFAPSEIYDEEYFDELNAMSNPKDEPNRILDEFLEVLDEFGPWCADKAAYHCLVHIQKQKLKTPYERHYLLLSIVETLLVKIRAIFDYELSRYPELERIRKFSTPKVQRLISIIKMFKPETNQRNSYDAESQLRDLNNCNFVILNDRLKKKCDEIIVQSEECKLIIAGVKSLVSYDMFNESMFKLQTNKAVDREDSLRNYVESNLNNSLPTDSRSSPNIENGSPAHNHKRRYDINNTRRQRVTKRTSNTVYKGGTRTNGCFQQLDSDALCGIILVRKKYTAKILFALLCELSRYDEDLVFLNVQYTVEKSADPLSESKEADVENKMQEDVLRRFRMHDCNLLIGTSVLEHGIDIPRCNLVLHWNEPESFSSFAHCKGRARSPGAIHAILITSAHTQNALTRLAEYREVEKMLLDKCYNTEPPASDEQYADLFTGCIKSYKPLASVKEAPSVNLLTAIALVNRYCAKLPSDTFTRLTPLWRLYELERNGKKLHQCVVRLPINSPVKRDIEGYPVASKILSRRMAALQTCIVLHKSGELDDNLQPLGKECLKVQEELHLLDFFDEGISTDPSEPRPGTTKRRQYYFKKIADALCDCHPELNGPCNFYEIHMNLTCPLPEEHNTRGRQIYDPEDSPHGFGLLTRKFIPKVGSFPIFTRSGEVSVSLNLVKNSVVITQDRMKMIYTFINYIFTKVLKLQKLFMLFDPSIANYSYFVVPTVKDKDSTALVDWNFLETIYLEETSKMVVPVNTILDETKPRVETNYRKNSYETYNFDPELYIDAVVMPWYRNQDTPQYFYVAEICKELNPLSPFPGSNFKCFEHYYLMKYQIKVKNLEQPLLDVDHTSGRLNFLTPRYVNRKGVALPTSSEETKRAKREDLGNKQILIPELCTIHPFPGALWRAAVCLPCILYRINGLLVADEIRSTVAMDIGLGTKDLHKDLEWPKLDFGWSLAEVYSKNGTTENVKNNNAFDKSICKPDFNEVVNVVPTVKNCVEKKLCSESEDDDNELGEELKHLHLNGDSEQEGMSENNESDKRNHKDDSVLEIGLWTNEMAEYSNENMNFGSCTMEGIRYGSPTSWDVSNKNNYNNTSVAYSDCESDDSYANYSSDEDTGESVEEEGGLHIEFQSDTIAEAIENDSNKQRLPLYLTQVNNQVDLEWKLDEMNPEEKLSYERKHLATIEHIKQDMIQNGVLVRSTSDIPQRQTQSKIYARHSKESNFELVQELISCYDNQIAKSQLEIEDLEQYNKLYIEKHGQDKKRLINAADYFEGMNISNISLDILTKVQNVTDIYDSEVKFSFDYQPDLDNHPGPSPSLILQALTMSNANDGINLERLETIGDSFLKYAITTYLYCTYDTIHEGKLSHLRSLQVSNLHLYRLGYKKNLGESMIATKFEPHDNWLPPCFHVPKDLEEALLDANIPATLWDMVNIPMILSLPREELIKQIRRRAIELGLLVETLDDIDSGMEMKRVLTDAENAPCAIPYNLITQHSIPDKSIADCVEALIGAYLIECGPRGALLFMSWLGIKVLPIYEEVCTEEYAQKALNEDSNQQTGYLRPQYRDGEWFQAYYGSIDVPPSPLLREVDFPEVCLQSLLNGYDALEEHLGYKFRDRAYLLQAMTHASYSPNRLTDCYQRLEFLGDAVLDYLITRHLYDSPMKHSPGALTDLRSALVNNIIFASLAVRHGFHRYFLHQSPGLHDVIARFVAVQEANGHAITEEYYLMEEDECEAMEDVEIPKALGDLFESVAGAIYLDSGMSLDAVWKVYYAMMSAELTQFGNSVPKSPIRELLEMEPETAKFGKPEKLADGRRVRVTVEVFGKGTFKGIGRNYRIAKCTAAKCALKKLKARNKHS